MDEKQQKDVTFYEELEERTCLVCMSLRGAILCIAFWQLSISFFCYLEAGKAFLMKEPNLVYAGVQTGCGLVNTLSSLVTFMGIFRNQKAIVVTYGCTLTIGSCLWAFCMYHVAVSSTNKALTNLSFIVLGPLCFINTFFAICAWQYLYLQLHFSQDEAMPIANAEAFLSGKSRRLPPNYGNYAPLVVSRV
eukprot:Platyproteum_vivax@DN5659_c0_g1_i1.p1